MPSARRPDHDPAVDRDAGDAAIETEVGATTSGDESWSDGPPASVGLIRLDLWGTVVFTVLCVIGAAFATPATAYPAAIWSGLLAAGGCLAFGWGYAIAVGRSRQDVIDLAGLFFLTRSAPPQARRPLLGLLTVQIVVGIAAAAIRPFTVLAFCVLAPVWGLGITTLWSARNGRFPPRGQHRPEPEPEPDDDDANAEDATVDEDS